jgi:uncharacterized protein YceH (UPF0502 family)
MLPIGETLPVPSKPDNRKQGHPRLTVFSEMQRTATEVRILGSLIEKESVTPDTYPLSLNALTAACNQLSNREPVMQLDENAVKYGVNSLRQQSLVRAIQPSDSRVMKFQHLADEKWNLDRGTRAVLCVLMLRGPQTPGEIKGRTGRLAEFAGLADVEHAMADLVARQLAVQLPRRPGQKEARYAHLLSGEPKDVAGDPVANGTASAPRDEVAAVATSTGPTLVDLQRQIDELRAEFDTFRKQFG